MKVVITEAAWAEMLGIGLAIKKHNPSRAATFIDELYARCHELGDMPRAFSLVPGHESSGIRRRVHGNYLIFYRIDNETIEIVHILHGAIDYEALLFPEN